MAPRKPAAKKRAPVRKNQIVKRKPRMSSFDGQNLLVSQYFEVELNQDAGAGAGGNMAYSITCDPNNCQLRLKQPAGTSTIQSQNGVAIAHDAVANAASVVSAACSFERFSQFKALFRQYKVNAVSVSVTTDRDCGLDNPVIFLTDKGEAEPNPQDDINKCMAQAHKEHILTESRRTCKYGWKPHTAQEREYYMTHSTIGADDLTTLKVLQNIEPKNSGKCTHRITLQMLVTLKDSKSLN
ncbi:hypothetical protein OAA16_00950 [Candidatus Pelagibacter sp.]|nr:hypothetical protein [Candidatus Pelagibacter sp.]